METPMYKEAILCLMFAMAEADAQFNNEELVECITMKDIFAGYTEQAIVSLYKEYKSRFSDTGFTVIANTFVRQIPEELYMGTLSVIADVAVVDFNVDIKESSFIAILAAAMGISDVSVKTLLMASLSKRLMINIGAEN